MTRGVRSSIAPPEQCPARRRIGHQPRQSRQGAVRGGLHCPTQRFQRRPGLGLLLRPLLESWPVGEKVSFDLEPEPIQHLPLVVGDIELGEDAVDLAQIARQAFQVDGYTALVCYPGPVSPAFPPSYPSCPRWRDSPASGAAAL